MQNNQNFRVKGALFENDRTTGPPFSGFIEIDGVRTQLVLWPKTSKKGINYFQISEDKKTRQPMPQPMAAPTPRQQLRTASAVRGVPAPYNDMDDDIPF